MDIQFIGHSSFLLKFKSAAVITDPYEEGSVGFKFPKLSADIVTISHGHQDHNNSSAVESVKKIIEGPGEYEVEGISIIGLPSYHDDKKGEERGKNTIYIFEADDLRVAHLGDLGHKPDQELFEKIGDIDVLMIPIGGAYTIDAQVAAEVAQDIEADIVIPMHYKTSKLKQDFPIEGVDGFINAMGSKVVHEKKYKVKKDDLLAEEQTIVVLEN